MIAAVLLMIAQSAPTNLPPCKNGAATCKPFERAWANPFDAFDDHPEPFAGTAKLVITWHQSDITLVDYQSQSRCEQARSYVMAEVRKRAQQSQADAPVGTVIIGRSPNGAFCIPG